MGLVYFEGGPLDGHAYETGTLMSQEALDLPILEYVWTTQKKTSEKTGAIAQIWRHKTVVGDSPASTVSAVAVKALAAAEYGSETKTAPAPAPVPSQPFAAAGAATVKSHDASADEPQAVAATIDNGDADAPASETVEAASDSDNLLDRRKKLKLNRQQVAEGTGLAVSKIINIENGTGSRVKDEERKLLADFIARCEQGVPAGAHA